MVPLVDDPIIKFLKILHFQMVLLDVLICWSNFHNKVAVHSVVISSNHHLNVHSEPSSLPSILTDEITDNHLLKRQKRVLVFRPLFVYKQQQKEKQKMKQKWETPQELHQQQYQSNYEQQYYQQYLQNYYSQFASSTGTGYYQNYNQPNYPYVPADTYSNGNDEHTNYWNYSTDNEQYDNYYDPYQHTENCYYPSSTTSDHNPSHYHIFV